jgi:hypothetical protein
VRARSSPCPQRRERAHRDRRGQRLLVPHRGRDREGLRDRPFDAERVRVRDPRAPGRLSSERVRILGVVGRDGRDAHGGAVSERAAREHLPGRPFDGNASPPELEHGERPPAVAAGRIVALEEPACERLLVALALLDEDLEEADHRLGVVGVRSSSQPRRTHVERLGRREGRSALEGHAERVADERPEERSQPAVEGRRVHTR